MKIQLTLVNRTDDSFARVMLSDGSTINYTDPKEAQDALIMFFGFNSYELEKYFNGPVDCSWESNEYYSNTAHIK